jgi:hypothetical protein
MTDVNFKKERIGGIDMEDVNVEEKPLTEAEKQEIEVHKFLISKFAVGELIPFKGIQFKVAQISGRGIALAPVGYTGRYKEEMRRQKRR